MAQTIKYPFGPATKSAVTAGATMALSVDNSVTYATISQMSADGTLNLTVNDEVEAGDLLYVRVSADGTNRALTPGTGMVGHAFTVTASKSFLLTFVFDGTNFISQSTLQLN